MLKNILFIMISFFYIGCGSSTVNDLLGIDENEVTIDTRNLNTSFKIKLEAQDLLSTATSDVVSVSYYIDDENNVQLFEYKSSLKSTVETTCIQTLVESDGITFDCTTDYTNTFQDGNSDSDLKKTIKLYNGLGYKVYMEEIEGLGNKSSRLIGTITLI